MAKKVFISIAAKTRARPRAAPMTRLLPKANLFFDVSTIGGGEDFVQRIESEIDRSDVALIFIGDKWLEPVPGDGQEPDFRARRLPARRVTNGSRAIHARLADSGLRARMPKPEQLPEDVRGISGKNALPLRHESFDGDTESIVGAVLGLSAKERAWEDKGSLTREIAYGVGGAVAASLLMLAMALVHHAVLARPLSASIGAPLTTLLLIVVTLCGIWLGLRYEARKRKLR